MTSAGIPHDVSEAVLLPSAEPQGPKQRTLLEYGALCMVWIIGLWALIWLLREFATAIKPLVLAALFVSILEYAVQLFEYMFKLFGIFSYYCVEKSWVLLGILFRELGNCSCWILSKTGCACCDWELDETRFTGQDRLFNRLSVWEELFVPWHASMAGKKYIYRIPAVIVTLALVMVAVLIVNYLLLNNVNVMIEHLDEYKEQLINIILFFRYKLQKLPETLTFLPPDIQKHLQAEVTKWQQATNLTSLAQSFQVYVLAILNGILAYSSTFIFELFFFLLYSFLWLFDPMHINADENIEADLKDALEKRLKAPKQPNRRRLLARSETVTQLIRKASPLFELQAHLNKIMWQYFFLKCTMNAIFALSCWWLLERLNVDLSGFIAVACFFLGFIPELGTIMAISLPVPLVVLAPPSATQGAQDSVLVADPDAVPNPWPDWNHRMEVLFWAVAGMCLIKILVSNLLEAWVMGRNKVLAGAVENHEMEKIKETHPVLILFAVVICGNIWGQVGMLISVPLISLMRLTINVWGMDTERKDL